MRSLILPVLLAFAAATTACKGETVYKDKPETAQKLEDLQKALAR